MKIDLNFKIFGLDKTPLKDEKGEDLVAAKVLAYSLAQNKFKEIDAMKAWERGQQLYDKGVFDLDKSDQALFKKAIKEELRYPAQVEAQILEAFEKKAPDTEEQQPTV